MTETYQLSRLPPGWGENELTRFIDETYSRTHKVAFRHDAQWRLILDIDKELDIVVGEFDHYHEDAVGLFVQGRQALRTAAMLAAATMGAPLYTMVRNGLECSLTGAAIGRFADVGALWTARSTMDRKASKAAWDKLKPSALLSRVQESSSSLAARWRIANDAAIELGAHPTFAAWQKARHVVSEGSDNQELLIISHTDETEQIAAGLRAVSDAAQLTLDLWRWVDWSSPPERRA